MKSFVNTEYINELFEILEEGKIEFVLLRNIDEELPDKLSVNKDIDIIVHPKDIEKLISTLTINQWNLRKHPWDFGDNFTFLYSMEPFLFFEKNQLHLDVCFQMACRSLNKGEWFPLDEIIQESIWIHKTTVDKPWLYVLSNEDYLIHLITRSIFDKKEFTQGYINEIEKLLPIIEMTKLLEKLEVVFFKFSTILIKMIAQKEYHKIRADYIKYSNY